MDAGEEKSKSGFTRAVVKRTNVGIARDKIGSIAGLGVLNHFAEPIKMTKSRALSEAELKHEFFRFDFL